MITATDVTTTGDTQVFLASGEVGITTLIICNHDSSNDAVVNVWVVPGTGSPRVTGTKGSANQILKSLTINATDTFVMDMEKLVLSLNDQIIVQSNQANAINCVISSMAVS